ncbi:MAG: winged helix-turn-helix domain-containing protein [Dehalococcoidia bacterium]|nr:winged helix-turn-helix domain-containing protein [Dehalococcoidia bacterium]
MGSGNDEWSHEFKNEISREIREREPSQQEWQVVAQALTQVQEDYSHARKQLGEVCNSFGERERVIGERVRNLLDTVTSVSSTTHDEKVEASREHTTRRSLVYPLTTSFRAYCFGSFELHLNGRKLDKWPSLKAKSLLKFLMSRRGKVTAKDVLIETLWPNCNPEVGSHNLKSAVYALRQALGRNEANNDSKTYCPFVVLSERQYLIAPNLDLWVDVDEFEQSWIVGRRLEREGRTEEATRHYQSAEELYRGDYMEDEPYAEWTLLRREALKDTYLAILGKLANTSLRTAEYQNCITYCQKILAKDSCHEEAYRWLIRCYSRLGQRHRALQWYNLCVTTLRRELDTTPDRETTALQHQLVHQDPI